MDYTKTNIIKNIFFSIKKVSKKDKIYILESIISILISATCTFAYPYIVKVAIDALENNIPFKELVIRVLIIIATIVLLNFINEVINNDMDYRKEKISASFLRDYHLESLKKDYQKFELPDAQDTFDKGARAVHNQEILSLCNNIFDNIRNFIVLIIGCGIALQVSAWLILIIIFLAIIRLLISNYNAKKRKTSYLDKLPPIRRKITYTDNVSRNLTNGKDLRVYDMDKFINKERQESVNEFLKLAKKESKRVTCIDTLLNILLILDEVALYMFMIYEVINNNMTIADFTFIVAAIRQLISSLTRIISNHSTILSTSLSINDYRKFLSMDLDYLCGDKIISDPEIEIEFKNVSYSYHMQEGYALNNISFKIKKGERIALVGENGAGKTTLIKLLCGFYHPTEGEILINGININEIDRENLIKLTAPVFQDFNHYAISIKDNIALDALCNIDNKKINEVIEIVGLKDKIDSLKDGIDTIITREIDDAGVELSGGENQKLSIARAIYKDAPLIVLDEPTSALDPLAESSLYKNLNKVINNHSAIFISHRLSSTKFCDRIFFLEKGKLTECGTHDELMIKNGEYKKLFDMQAEYYKGVN